jgi:FtsH-binding integral membrane protein
MAVDAGLRSFMLGVFNKMGLGLLVSAVIAYTVGTVAPVTQAVLSPPVVYIVQWAPLVLLMGSNFFMRNPSPTGAAALYWTIVALLGAGLGVWVYLATNGIVAQTAGGRTLTVTFGTMAKAFFTTAIAFGGLALWGYTTKRDLSPIGGFLFIATFGLVAIGILNFFLFKSPMLEVGLQVAILLVYGLLVAFQTQSLKESYYAMGGDQRAMSVMTSYGALNLYIAFVTIFQTLLSTFSSND